MVLGQIRKSSKSSPSEKDLAQKPDFKNIKFTVKIRDIPKIKKTTYK